jgi:CheY-like chemotaxis protein
MKAIGVQQTVPKAMEEPVRVLLLGDSLTDSQDILEELRAAGINVEPTVVSARREFLEAISSQDFSIVLSAHRLAEWSGLEALGELQKAGKIAPFILVAEELEKEEAAECLQDGVSDYVLRNHLMRLPAIVRRALEEKQLRETNRETRQALEESERRNRELIENSVYGVFRVTLDGSFILANPSLLEILACASLQGLQSMNFQTDIFRYPEHCAKLINSCKKDGLVHSAERRRAGGGKAEPSVSERSGFSRPDGGDCRRCYGAAVVGTSTVASTKI